MTWLILFVLVVLLFCFKLSVKSPNSPASIFSESNPYASKNPLTATEAVFYHRLAQALPNYIVLAQVQLSSFLKIQGIKIHSRDFYRWFNPIAQQSVDYLICTKEFSIVAAVELDDRSHSKPDAIKRDIKKSNNLTAANIPLIRWHVEAMPELTVIQQEILKYANQNNSAYVDSENFVYNQSSYFDSSNQHKTSLFINLIFIAIFIVFLFWSISEASKRVSEFGQSRNNQTLNTPNVVKETNHILDMENMQQAKKIAQEKAEKEQLSIERQIIQQQQQERISKIEEVALKDKAWQDYYKNQGDCTAQNDIVKCGNEYIKQRKNFGKLKD